MTCEISYEELAAFGAGDLSAERHAVIEQHVATCDDCRGRLATLKTVDTTLKHMPAVRPSAETILAARRFIAEETRPRAEPEILTMDEVAAFLRIEPEELQSFVLELPAFELGGQIRVRRCRLVEWVEQREREFRLSTTASAMARIRAANVQKGVA